MTKTKQLSTKLSLATSTIRPLGEHALRGAGGASGSICTTSGPSTLPTTSMRSCR
jgi:hypothetical protein